MNIDQLIEELFSLTFNGIKPGLERTLHLCEVADNPQMYLPVVHVAGTNGKGSTCSMLAAILQSAGYNVGLYTSPHISVFNERIAINGVHISNEDVARLASPLMAEAKLIGGTFFEVTTVMALRYFAEKRVDIAIIETGLGGKLDSTNVVNPLLSVITSIDIDHTNYLGNSLLGIAREKAGIIKEHAIAVVGEDREELRSAFNAMPCEKLIYTTNVAHVDVDRFHPDMSMTVSVIGTDFPGYYTTDMCGYHQSRNIAAVLTSISELRSTYFIDEDHVRQGLARVKQLTGLQGRIQRIGTSPLTILDVAHNPAGIAALIETLNACGYDQQEWHVVFGAMSDKDVSSMIGNLVPICNTMHACSPHIPRSMSVEEVAALSRQHHITNTIAHTSVADAVRSAMASGPTLIVGSFHVADEALAAIRH